MSNENHPLFLKYLTESEAAVWEVARWLQRRGTSVTVKASGQAPAYSDWQDYSDNGDLELVLRGEVKHLGCEFSGLADWPFPDFMVCNKHSYDKAFPKPAYYFYLSKSKRSLGVLNTNTSSEWWVKKRSDHRFNGREQEFYITKPSLVKFHSFEGN
jgi:hypothetical protein